MAERKKWASPRKQPKSKKSLSRPETASSDQSDSSDGVNFSVMSRAAILLYTMPEVDIDASGIFPYILVRVFSKERGDKAELEIVRGYEWADSHDELFEKVSDDLKECAILDCELIGGGLINREPENKKMYLFTSATGVKKTDHSVAGWKLRDHYTNYLVTWQEE